MRSPRGRTGGRLPLRALGHGLRVQWPPAAARLPGDRRERAPPQGPPTPVDAARELVPDGA
eukprot:7086232-Prymnesium_polylepis.1